jgi:hypothetical protein
MWINQLEGRSRLRGACSSPERSPSQSRLRDRSTWRKVTADDRNRRSGEDRRKTKRPGVDRRVVAGSQGYEVGYFARKHGITAEQARALIEEIGNDREKLNAAAEKLKQ